jgi:hypothetical protein
MKTMMRKQLFLMKACLAAATMMFAACEPAEDDPTPDPGTEQDANFVAFTFEGIDGAAVIDKDERTVSAKAKETVDLADITAEFTLSTGATATVDGTPQVSGTTANDFNDPVTYTVTSGDGETTLDWTVTIIKEMAVGKKYITYNKPVTAYYIEYNGGAVDANKNGDAGNYGDVIEAYEDQNYTAIEWESAIPGWNIWYVSPSGLDYTSTYGNTEWYRHTGNGGGLQDADGWAVAYKEYEYPLGEFAAYVSTRKSGGGFLGYGHTLWDIAGDTDTYEMPDNTEVTEFYVRSEKVMDITCDVYQAHDRTYDDDLTWWVDPATGLTLKYERKTADGDTESYEVTKLTVGAPEWDKLHLHPIDGDTFVDVD